MILYVDSENKIRAVNSTSDTTLTPLYVDETNPEFPFTGWSTAKICCYKVTVVDGVITMMTPYVDSRMLEAVDNMGHMIDDITPYTETKTAYIDDTEIVFEDIPKGSYTVTFDNPVKASEVMRENFTDNTSTITVKFEPLEEVTEVTLTIH